MASYLPPALPAAPDSYDWLTKVSRLGPMGNLAVGDCTCAGAGHHIQMDSAAQGREIILPDEVILALYSKLGGYVPGRPETDNGLYLIQVLKEWQQNGIPDGQGGLHKIGAYVQINPQDSGMLALACWLFGGVYCGVALPLSAQGQQTWDVVNGGADPRGQAGSWGGHCVPMGAFDPGGGIFVTWGEEQYATRAFIQKYFDEAWALLDQDFLDGKQDNPLGINVELLNQDLQAVKAA